MDAFMHRVVDIKSELDSSAGSRTAGTDGLLPQLATVLAQLQQVSCALLTTVVVKTSDLHLFLLLLLPSSSLLLSPLPLSFPSIPPSLPSKGCLASTDCTRRTRCWVLSRSRLSEVRREGDTGTVEPL